MSRSSPDYIQMAEIMDNRDPLYMGRLKVWMINSTKPKTDPNSWITASYCSPFAGNTQGKANASNYSEFPKSYGCWMVPPDIGNRVFLFFVNGQQDKAYWFGGVFDSGTNNSVPTSPSGVNPSSDNPVPSIEYDRNKPNANKKDVYLNIPLMKGIINQNLVKEEQKALPNTSARRQIPSTMYGLSSPRGSSIYIDDGYTDSDLDIKSWDEKVEPTRKESPYNSFETKERKNEEIRMRTRSGAQVLISETEGNIFVINRDGTARVELTEDGRILIHSDKSFSVKSEEDINFIASGSINMQAGKNMNIKVESEYKQEVGGNVNYSFSGDYNISSSTYSITTSDFDCSSVINAINFTTPQAGFNEHIHPYTQHVSKVGEVPKQTDKANSGSQSPEPIEPISPEVSTVDITKTNPGSYSKKILQRETGDSYPSGVETTSIEVLSDITSDTLPTKGS